MAYSKSFFLCIILSIFHRNSTQYQADWSSLDLRPLPLWYDEAKFGIFCHWGVFSVPAFHDEWFWFDWKKDNMSSIVTFMQTHYKPSMTYADFARDFTAIDFDAYAFANIIKSSGAKYYVQTTKHHEGFTLWPNANSWNWNAGDLGPGRDLLQEIRQAILNVGGIHWGTYFSLFEWFNPLYLYDKQNNQTTSVYVDTVSYPQLLDLITNYQPDVLWSDGDWEMYAEYWRSEEFIAWLYNESPVKDTIVTNDRWGKGCICNHGGYHTCADHFLPGKLQSHKWEDADTLDKLSWGYRRNVVYGEILKPHDVIQRLVSVIATGGNYLLNIGPDSNGRLLPIFEERLNQIGIFVNAHEEAIFATKPWIYQNDSNSAVWYTSKLRNDTGLDPYRLLNPQSQVNTIIYAFVVTWPDNNTVNLFSVIPTAQTTVNLFAVNNQFISVPYEPLQPAPNQGIQVDISGISFTKFVSPDAFVLKIEYAADQCPLNFTQSNVSTNLCLSLASNATDFKAIIFLFTYFIFLANTECRRRGGNLITVGNAFENGEVQELVKNCPNAYIGLQLVNGNWVWVNGDTAAYRDWDTGCPKADPTLACAAIQPNGNWINQDCATISCYICQAPL